MGCSVIVFFDISENSLVYDRLTEDVLSAWMTLQGLQGRSVGVTLHGDLVDLPACHVGHSKDPHGPGQANVDQRLTRESMDHGFRLQDGNIFLRVTMLAGGIFTIVHCPFMVHCKHCISWGKIIGNESSLSVSICRH